MPPILLFSGQQLGFFCEDHSILKTLKALSSPGQLSERPYKHDGHHCSQLLKLSEPTDSTADPLDSKIEAHETTPLQEVTAMELSKPAFRKVPKYCIM